MTQPDEAVPDGAITDTGLAAYAATTGQDWEDYLNGILTGSLDGAVSGFTSILQQIPIIGDIIEILTGIEDGDLNDLGTWVNTVLLDSWIPTLVEAITGVVDGTVTTISNFFTGFLSGDWGPLLEQLVDAFTGLAGGLSDIVDWVEGFLGDIAQLIANLLGISRRGSNLVTNPGFEDSTYYLVANTSYDTSVKRSGAQSVKVLGASANTRVIFTNTDTGYAYIPASPGDTYELEAWVYGDTGNVSTHSSGLTLYAASYDTSLTLIGYQQATVITASPSLNGVWTKMSGSIQTPANTAFVVFFGQVQSNVPAGEDYFWDGPIVREVTKPQSILDAITGGVLDTVSDLADFFFGILAAGGSLLDQFVTALTSLGGDFGDIVEWVASLLPWNLFSKMQRNHNLATDPNVDNSELWSATSGTIFSVGTNVIQATMDASGGVLPFLRNPDGSNTSFDHGYLPVKAGQVWRMSCDIKRVSGTTPSTVLLRFRGTDSAGGNTWANQTFDVTSTSFTNIEFTRTITTEVKLVPRIEFNTGSVAVGNVYQYTNMRIVEVTEPQNIIDALTGGTMDSVADVILWVAKIPFQILTDVTYGWFSTVRMLLNSLGLAIFDEDPDVQPVLGWVNWLDNRVSGDVHDAFATGGANLANDPRMTAAELWNDTDDLSYYITTDESYSGTTSLMATVLQAGASIYPTIDLVRTAGGEAAPVVTQAGEVFEFSVWMKEKSSNTGTTQHLYLQATYVNSVTSATTNDQGAVTTPSSAIWQQMELTCTVPAGYDTVYFQVIIDPTMPVNDVFYLDNPVVLETTRPANTIDTIVQGMNNDEETGRSLIDVLAALLSARREQAEMAAALAALTADANANSVSGASYLVDVAQYGTSMPSTLTKFTDTGSGSVSNDGTALVFSNATGTELFHYNADVLLTDYAEVSLVITKQTGDYFGSYGDRSVYWIGRMNSAGTSFVFARLRGRKMRIGVVKSGTSTFASPTWITHLGSSSTDEQTINVGSYMTVRFGTITGVHYYEVLTNNQVVGTWQDTGAVGLYGSSYRKFGAGLQNAAVDLINRSAKVSHIFANDNYPVDVVGSGAIMKRTSATGVSGSSGANEFPANFFNTYDEVTPDIDIDLAGNSFTPATSGWYSFGFRVVAGTGVANHTQFLLYKDGVAWRYAGQDSMRGVSNIGAVQAPISHSAVWGPMYVAAGEEISIGYNASASYSDMFQGASDGLQCYFTCAKLNG